jgi:dipeptidase E
VAADHMHKRQIIAMGGGGFSMEPDNPALDLYVLAQVRKRTPAVCFLATASGDADGYIEKFYAAFKTHRCRPTHVPLFRRTPVLKQVLLTQDVIYVGGGNTKSMLAVWREWDVPRLLRRAWGMGIVLTGISAGAICWFRTGVTDSAAVGLSGLPCLGFFPERVVHTSMVNPNGGRHSIASWPLGRSRGPLRWTTALRRTLSGVRSLAS